MIGSLDIASIDASLGWWEMVEYFAEGFVILACIGEFLAEFTEIRTEAWRHGLGKFSTIVLVVALSLELLALVRTNNLSGREISGLNLQAAELLAQIQPRTLSINDQRRLTNSCSAYAGHSLGLYSYSGDPEGARLSLQILTALQAGGIRVENRIGALLPIGGAAGVGIAISAIDRGLAMAISDSLAAAHITSTVNPPRPDERQMTMTVGTKPYDLFGKKLGRNSSLRFH